MFTQKKLNMKQRRWVELVNDYGIEILYHPGKAKVVADALSRKTAHSSALITGKRKLQEAMIGVGIEVIVKGLTARFSQLTV